MCLCVCSAIDIYDLFIIFLILLFSWLTQLTGFLGQLYWNKNVVAQVNVGLLRVI